MSNQQSITYVAFVEVTKQMKPTDGRCQAEIRLFRVKVYSLETTNVEGVDSVHVLEDIMIYSVMVSYISSFRGLSPWYGTAWKSQELGRACINSGNIRIVANDPERRGRGESVQAVGPTHSRGVAGVMASESLSWHSKGLAILRKGKGIHYLLSLRS
jgi:hypothetical protein